MCTCLPGFEPSNEDDWKSGDFSGGCKKIPSKCTRDNKTLFVKINVTMVLSNTPHFIESRESECISECQNNCTCQAYAYKINETDYRNLSSGGYWFWFGDLDDIQEGSTAGNHVLFYRVDFPSQIGTLSSLTLMPFSHSWGLLFLFPVLSHLA